MLHIKSQAAVIKKVGGKGHSKRELTSLLKHRQVIRLNRNRVLQEHT